MPEGLSAAEAARRLAQDGPNELVRESGTPAWRMIAAQFSSPLVLLLLGAGVLSFALGEWVDALAIASIALLNGGIGFAQEYSAQNAILALRAQTAPRAKVSRDGHAVVIPAAEVVKGDLLLLEAGDVVAADAHVLAANALVTNEASLTGESLPVEKVTEPAPADAPLAERQDQVFLGTAVVTGTGSAEVLKTGMSTELGKIASLLGDARDDTTPLQRELAVVGRTLLVACLAVVGVVAAFGLARGQSALEVMLTAIPLAVAAVPEGLPAIVTVALSVGVRRMAARHVLVRKLPAVETLGSATVICTDKTGTLTTGVMAVREVWGDRAAVLDVAAGCCDAELGADGDGVGDPMEVAILRAAREDGIERPDLERDRARVEVHPFDAVRKRMSILRGDGRLYVKGAPELLVPICTSGTDGALAKNEELASRGLRVLGVAVGKGPEERDLVFLGLIGLQDPPREEVVDAIAAARRAGIRTVMITGDQQVTAVAIARELGLLGPDEDPADWVHARVTPEDKLNIVRSWKDRGFVVAMTGDGVNDAPALREAHVGIAMGQAGTEVTREAADLVLTNDDFSSIVYAIREGRGVYENIQKTVTYLLAGNFGELIVVFGATALGWPLPLLPLQLLWVNLVTDGLPALALVTDPAPADALERPPRPVGAPMLGRHEWTAVVGLGLLDAAVVLGVFWWAWGERGLDEARNLAFATLVFVELFRVFAARSRTRTFFEVGAFTNVRLLAVIGVSVALQIGLHHIPLLQQHFGLVPLSLADLGMVMGLGFVPATLMELGKLAWRVIAQRGGNGPPGAGTNSTSSPGTTGNVRARQAAAPASMSSGRLDTRFHQM